MSTQDATRPLGKHVTTDRDDTLPMAGEVGPVALGGMIGRYLVLSVLGHGGMGVVYAVYDPALDRKIAVKLLREAAGDDATEGRTRMQREAQALARLSHPNVITVHDVSEFRGSIYIAMELVAGGTLTDWQRGKSWRELLDVYISAARGLAAAHAVGLIHRDFKPDNVLVGDDGRVRVTDFGLARLVTREVEAPADAGASPTSTLASDLTAAGSVMGTPRYMAPEQIEGGVVDARTDQFSWCVALWEALYGEQPFPTANLALRAAAIHAEPPVPPATTKLPRGLARVLLRGLAPDPDRRWPSLDAAIDELQRIATPRRTLVAGGAVVAMAGVATIFVLARSSPEPAGSSCDAAGSPIDATWSDDARRQVEASFAATGRGFAGDAAHSVERALDSWRGRWREIAVESCRATREIGVQSPAVLDLRTACLERRRDELQAIVAALQHADAKLVEHAPSLALPDLETCRDIAGLTGTTAPPTDPVKARERTAIEHELAALEGELVDGVPLDRARTLDQPSQALVARAVAVGWPSLIARARRARADVERELGKGKPARTTLLAAAAAASAGGDLDQLVSIYLDLADVEARLTSEFSLGDGWTELAEGTLARLGPRIDKKLSLYRHRALLASRAGRLEDVRAAYEAALGLARTKGPIAELEIEAALGYALGELNEHAAAIAHLDRAHALATAELGPNHPRVGTIAHDRGTISYRRGKYAEAEQLFRNALAIRTAAFGGDEITVATSAQALGVALLAQGRIADAQAQFERALHILEARLGPEHPDVANALNDIGGAYHQAGDFVQELAFGKRALAVREKVLGPEHPDVAQSLVNTAIASKALGRWDIVEPNYTRAIAIFEKTYGKTNVSTAITRLNFAEALRVRGKLAEAEREYGLARDIMLDKLGKDHPALAHIWNGLGQLELARGRLPEAVGLLERAVALREKDPGDAPALAESRFALARALGNTDRGRELASKARDAYRATGSSFAAQVDEIERWLGR